MKMMIAAMAVVLGILVGVSGGVRGEEKTPATTTATKPVAIQKYIDSLPKNLWPKKGDTEDQWKRRNVWYEDNPARVTLSVLVDDFDGKFVKSDHNRVIWFGQGDTAIFHLSFDRDERKQFANVRRGDTVKIEATIQSVRLIFDYKKSKSHYVILKDVVLLK